MTTLGDLATTFRSKNAEPFMTTMDIYLPAEGAYERVKAANVITEECVAELYNIPPEAVYGVFFIDSLRAVKVTILKYGADGYLGQGDPALTDMFGAQQHVPLLALEVA
jgi:Domain of unknown function (DUF4387)